jgi:PTS system nitrogen regulatory IIA component|tara:strand:+ start:1040 stop:1519 length:480 start_codon:yes stop_codon:yes gene_type:complete
MEISDLLTIENVITDLRVTSKKQVLQILSKHAANNTGQDERYIFEVLSQREHLGTTGVGDGRAIPHGHLLGLKNIQGYFARLENPIDFDSIDDSPVDLIFLLLAPKGSGAEHLKALALISRLMRSNLLCEKLRGANNADALYALLSRVPQTRPNFRVAS